jgi:TonB family protein
MNSGFRALGRFLVIFACVSGTTLVSAQSDDFPADSRNTVVLSKLFPPAYPPLARQARIEGDVEVTVRVRPDGSIESAAVISGAPMLGPAALMSARKSEYECRACTGLITYNAIYTFRLPMTHAPAQEWNGDPPPADIVSQSQNHITVINNEPGRLIVDRIAIPVRIRSARCLYLWRCGHR